MKADFSGFNFFCSLLAGTATVASLVTIQPVAIFATQNNDIRAIGNKVIKIANPVTVQINPQKGGGGSGVIIDRQGNTYTVVTCIHVIASIDRFQNVQDRTGLTIRTNDGQVHPLTIVKKLGTPKNSDLAIVTFTSENEYQKATLAKSSDDAVLGAMIFVSGYPAISGKLNSERPYRFAKGSITNRSKIGPQNWQSYTMEYNAQTEGGMSGGPVFDKDGRVIGIHGQGGEVPLEGFQMKVSDENKAVPISTFWNQKSESGVEDLDLAVDETPSTDNPEERLNNPESGFDYFAKASAEAAQGNKSKAVESFNQAIERDPNLAEAYYHRANIRFDQNDKQGALADYNQAIRLNPDYTNAYFNRGAIRFNQGDKEGALEDFDEYISRSPNNAEAYYNRGYIRRTLGNSEASLEDFDEIVRLLPNEPRAYYNRGVIRIDVQDNQGAIEDLQKAADLFKQQGLQDESDNHFYQKAQEIIQKLQAAGDTSATEQPEPEDNSDGSVIDDSETEQPDFSDESDQPNLDDSATSEPENGRSSEW